MKPLSIQDLFARLNPQQRQAAKHGDGPAADRRRRRHRQDGHAGPSRGLADRQRRRSGPNPAADLHPPGRRRDAPPRRRPSCGSLTPGAEARAGQGRCVPAGSGAAPSTPSPPACSAATARPSGCRPSFTHPRPGRLRGPAERGPHRAGPGQDRPAVPQEGNLHGHLQPLRQRPARSSTHVLTEHFPWCLDWAEELKRLFDAYVDRKEAAGILDYDDLLLYWHALLADPKAGAGRPQPVRLRAGRRVPGHQRAAGRDPLPALARRQGADRGGRRRPVDLLLPRGHGPQHPRLPQALPGHDGRHAGAELSQHAADPRGHQPGDRPGPRAVHQEPLVRADRRASGRRWSPARTRTTRPTT